MKRHEDALQIAVVRFLELQRIDGFTWNAINPCPSKSRTTAVKSKAMGMRAGWPDFIMVYRGTPFGVELKAGKGRLSPAQVAIGAELYAAGVKVEVARSLDEVVGILGRHGVPLKGRLAA